MAEISQNVKSHLVNVYATLTATCVAASVGNYVEIKSYFAYGGLLTSLLGMALFVGILSTRDTPQNRLMRGMMLLGFGFLQGVSLSPLLFAARFASDGMLVTKALTSTAVMFASFTGAAMTAKRQSYMYLGGWLASAGSLLMWLSLFNVFMRSSMMNDVALYCGLLLFSGYVVYDTQVIMEKAERGSRDFIAHGAQLFVDAVALFTRILVLLMKKDSPEDKRRKYRERRQ